jgi:hypothetical protein
MYNSCYSILFNKISNLNILIIYDKKSIERETFDWGKKEKMYELGNSGRKRGKISSCISKLINIHNEACQQTTTE